MAKQTFTAAQILTAAQMTSLQQTAMGGGSATAKTTSYVLVAADAGTTVAMNAAGATTITVNTGLFAAGDTVFIQNLGAGATTITAGSATVATAGSLILPQYDAGILYFTATGAAIFYDYIQTGAASPLTTKGDLYTFSTSDTRLAVGTNTHVLTADSAQATGLKWAAPAGGGKLLQLVNTQITSVLSMTNSGTIYTFIDATGFSVTITPTLNTSKILFQANISGALCSSGGANRVYFRIVRDSTVIGVGDAGTGNQSSSGFFNTDGNATMNNFLFWLDSPATTSAVTYKIQLSCNLASLVYHFNRPADTLGAYSPLTASQLTVMEIGA